MAFVDITSDQHATYGTHSHAEEGFATRGGAYPGQLRWSDLHPPGVRVLPKGSPPAGPGEFNWEDTLGGKFALALEKLEGLLYAVYGSRPHAEPDGSGGWLKRQWYDRQHPRCLWGPEMWERRLLVGPLGCDEQGQCWDYQEDGKEYAALGEYPPCCPMPSPAVPIRSRSGDPNGAFATGTHDRAYFPIGSVSRDFASEPFDSEGYGWFGATQPGRQDGVGYEEKDGQAVTFRWIKPAGVPTPTSLQLCWKRRLPGGTWSGHETRVTAGREF